MSSLINELQNRRLIARLKSNRQRLKREILSEADDKTRQAFSRMEQQFDGYLVFNSRVTPVAAGLFESLLEIYLFSVRKQVAWEHQFRNLSELMALPGDLLGLERMRQIVTRCQEQKLWYRDLIHSVGEGADDTVLDADRQINLLKQRIEYIETCVEWTDSVNSVQTSIERLFCHLHENSISEESIHAEAMTVCATAQRLLVRLTEESPTENCVALLLGD